jgi:hypothetical protein
MHIEEKEKEELEGLEWKLKYVFFYVNCFCSFNVHISICTMYIILAQYMYIDISAFNLCTYV